MSSLPHTGSSDSQSFGCIYLRDGQQVLVDADDAAWLSQWNWWDNGAGYAVRDFRTNGRYRKVYMHREIVNAKPGQYVDHWNRNKLDNRRANLRIVNQSQNCANSKRSRNNTSGYKGVSYFQRDNNWRAVIKVNYKYRHIGYFDTAEDAARAYDAVARQIHGEFAATNFSEDV